MGGVGGVGSGGGGEPPVRWMREAVRHSARMPGSSS